MGRAWFLCTRNEGFSPPAGAGGAGSGHAGAGGGSSIMTADPGGSLEGDEEDDEETAFREGGPAEPLHPTAVMMAKKSAVIAMADFEAAVIARESTGRAGRPGTKEILEASPRPRAPGGGERRRGVASF